MVLICSHCFYTITKAWCSFSQVWIHKTDTKLNSIKLVFRGTLKQKSNRATSLDLYRTWLLTPAYPCLRKTSLSTTMSRHEVEHQGVVWSCQLAPRYNKDQGPNCGLQEEDYGHPTINHQWTVLGIHIMKDVNRGLKLSCASEEGPAETFFFLRVLRKNDILPKNTGVLSLLS